jgi:hypothetical protein
MRRVTASSEERSAERIELGIPVKARRNVERVALLRAQSPQLRESLT